MSHMCGEEGCHDEHLQHVPPSPPRWLPRPPAEELPPSPKSASRRRAPNKPPPPAAALPGKVIGLVFALAGCTASCCCVVLPLLLLPSPGWDTLSTGVTAVVPPVTEKEVTVGWAPPPPPPPRPPQCSSQAACQQAAPAGGAIKSFAPGCNGE